MGGPPPEPSAIATPGSAGRQVPVTELFQPATAPTPIPTEQPSPKPAPLPVLDGRTTSEAVLFEIRRVIVGQDQMLERVLVALLAGGHLLLEGVPGPRQDPDDQDPRRRPRRLLPAHPVHAGPRPGRPRRHPHLPPRPRHASTPSSARSSANFLLADEINRAPAKVQSALLEVMQERQVTIGPESLRGPRPFLVMATQNPIESEGTYPLPEAQVDRFMMKVVVGYPTAARGGARRRALAPPGRRGPAASSTADGLADAPGR